MESSDTHRSAQDTSSESLDTEIESPPPQKRIGFWALVFVAYFWVSGGMYGVEPLLRMAPPAYVFMALLLVPLVYCVPISFICTDLSVAYPFDSGFIAWINIAFGTTLGAHNVFWLDLAFV